MRRVAGISGSWGEVGGGGSSLASWIFVDISWIFLGFSEFSENFWRILEVLEEFCNVERRLEGGDGLAPESFGK